MDSLIAKADAINTVRPLNRKRKFQDPSSSSSSRSNGQQNSKRKEKQKQKQPNNVDQTLASISTATLVPRSLRTHSPPPPGTKLHKHIKNPSLRLKLARQSEHSTRSKQLVRDAAFLTEATGAVETGAIEIEGDLEKTWRLSQDEIVKSVGGEAAKGRREWNLDETMGPYRCRYTRNGRHLLVAGRNGHVASFDWKVGTLHAEIQLRETCRDVTYLHDQSHFAVAQKKYVFIYDKNGVELHRLTDHIEPTRLEFLPYHWLLVSVGLNGRLTYHDTSTGQLLAQHSTKLGSCTSLAQNPHTAVVYAGHTNGTVTLWTPNMSTPVVRLQAHLGNVSSIGVNPAVDGGRYLATAGMDGCVKVWDCRNWKGVVREWKVRSGGGGGKHGVAGAELEWSGKGFLAVAAGGAVNVYSPPTIHNPPPGFEVTQPPLTRSIPPPPLYLTHPIPHRPLLTPRFCPYTDILTIPHASGLSSILVPGAGIANFDSREADPFESSKERREREVHALLEKIEGTMVGVGDGTIGTLATTTTTTATGSEGKIGAEEIGKGGVVDSFTRLKRWERLRVSGKMDETKERDSADEGVREDIGDVEKRKEDKEKREKMKMRGKGKSLKRYLRKQRKNVIDPTVVAIRAKLEKQRAERREVLAVARGEGKGEKKKSALDRFKRKPQS